MNIIKTILNQGCVTAAAVAAALLTLQPTAFAATLAHEYNFTDDGSGVDVVDLVGGPAWMGTLPNGGDFATTPGQLILSASGGQYVNFPAGMLSNYTAVTIDMWATYGTLPNSCFAFAFGYTDSGGGGGNCIFLQPLNGRLAISGGDPSWQAGEQNAYFAPGNLSGLTVHLTAVINPALGYEAVYTNGFLAGVNLSETVPLSVISNQLAYIARSLYTGDQYMDVTVDEYRIWNGTLNPLEIAGQDLAGPNTVSTNYGTVNGLTLQIASPIAIGAGANSIVSVTTTTIANPIRLSTPDISASFTSLNPTIATVNSTNGTVVGVESGTAKIVASYGGIFATQAVQVISLPTTMIHRYSFNENTTTDGDVVHDSVGTNNGTFHNGSGSSSISGGSLNLNGTSPGDYVDLGSYLISTTNIANNAVTMEGWVTVYPGNGNWTRLWEFGNFQSGGVIGNSSGANYWSFMPTTATAGLSRTEWNPGGNLDVDYSGHTFQGWTNVHVVAVFNPNPSRQFFGLYINGALVNSGSTAGRSLAGLDDFYSWLGRSLWSGDSALQGQISEFRIYNGELNRFQIAASDQAGPDTTNFNIGSFTSFSLGAGTMPMALGTTRSALAYANFTLVTNVLVTGDPNLTLSSSNTNVFTVTPAGLISATGVGSATLNASYNYIVGATTNTYTGSTSVSVYRDQVATMTHRYSFFNEPDGSLTATDSVARADGTLNGAADITGGQLVIPNTAQTAPAPDYLLLPDGILTNAVNGVLATNGVGTIYNDPAVTVEAWATFAASQGYWAALFDFGYTDGSGYGAYDIHVGQLGGSTTFGISDTDNANGFNQTGTAGSVRGTSNIHIVAVFNPPAGYLACYTNGVLASQLNGITITMEGIWGTLNKVGADLWPDPGMQGSVSEFRIYNGVLHADEVAATQVLGPTQALTTSASLSVAQSGSNLVLSWPLAAAGFTLKSSSSLTSGSWTTVSSAAPQIVGSMWQITVPKSGGTQFYRLSR